VKRISAGIDLGTTNSCLAVLQGDCPVALPNDLNEPITPSVVAVQPDGVIVGRKARGFLLTHPAQTFVSIKRKMGERYARTVLGKEYTPETVSALILGHLKQCGERHLGETLDDVVITVPANFNSVQRQATKDAGEIAGFNVLRVVNEPTAAALAYGHEHQLSSVMVVFDLGGGTFDISVVEAGDGLFEVIHSVGDNHLGGDDFNLRVVSWIVQEFQRRHGEDIRRDVPAMQLVHEWAIAAKHTLTKAPEVRVKIDNLYKGKGFDAVLTRGLFETLSRDLFERLLSIAQSVVEHLKAPKYSDAHPGVFDNQLEGCDVLLVGGETRVPAVRQLVGEVFKGALRTDVNPDEVVAMGAALQAGIIHQHGDVKGIMLVDTTALPLGIEVEGGLFSKIIDANTKIPCTQTSEYEPVADNQRAARVCIFQGESELADKNVKLGEFEFLLQPPRPKQDAVVQITFHLDANDILHVSAVDKKTGAKQTVTIKDSQNLDRATVERLRREAQQNRPADRARVERIRKRQRDAALIEEVRWRLREVLARDPGNKFASRTADYANRLEQALKGTDDSAVERAAADLDAAWQKLLTSMPPVDAPPATETSRPAATAAPPSDPAATVNCAHCGARLPPGFAFCGKCGMPLKQDACGQCGAALVEGFAFCGKCGAKVTSTATGR
jgi:molecular chaperone DnaK